MLNYIVAQGRLTKNPELRKTPNGVSVTSFTIAVERDFDKNATDFIDVVAWRNTAEFVSKYFTKGRMVIVTGKLQIRKWTDKEGNERRTAEIIADKAYFSDSKNSGTSDFTEATGDIEPMENAEEDYDLPF